MINKNIRYKRKSLSFGDAPIKYECYTQSSGSRSDALMTMINDYTCAKIRCLILFVFHASGKVYMYIQSLKLGQDYARGWMAQRSIKVPYYFYYFV